MRIVVLSTSIEGVGDRNGSLNHICPGVKYNTGVNVDVSAISDTSLPIDIFGSPERQVNLGLNQNKSVTQIVPKVKLNFNQFASSSKNVDKIKPIKTSKGGKPNHKVLSGSQTNGVPLVNLNNATKSITSPRVIRSLTLLLITNIHL